MPVHKKKILIKTIPAMRITISIEKKIIKPVPHSEHRKTKQHIYFYFLSPAYGNTTQTMLTDRSGQYL